jgi:DNA-binding CsgD family transcriptional regulator
MKTRTKTAKTSNDYIRNSWHKEFREILGLVAFNSKEVENSIAEHIRTFTLAEQTFPSKSVFLLFDNAALSYIFISKSVSKVLGYTADECMSMGYKESLLAFYSEQELEYKMAAMNDVFSFIGKCDRETILNLSVKYDMVLSKKNGEQIHVVEEMWFPEVNENAQPTLTIGFLHDLSDFSIIQHSGNRKCVIQLENSTTQKKLFSKSYAIRKEGKPPLSDREQQILELFSDGLTNIEAAAKLFLTENTIKTHRKNILLAMGVKKMSEAVKIAIKSGWLS